MYTTFTAANQSATNTLNLDRGQLYGRDLNEYGGKYTGSLDFYTKVVSIGDVQAEAKYAGSTSVQAYVIMETEAEITQDESVTSETRVDENTLKPAKTGDDTPVMLWTAVFSGACILFWTVKRFKNT